MQQPASRVTNVLYVATDLHSCGVPMAVISRSGASFTAASEIDQVCQTKAHAIIRLADNEWLNLQASMMLKSHEGSR